MKRSSGFSLIELMVVMAIMAVLMGLTGALVTKTVAQRERQIEIENVKQLFKKMSYQAFYEGYKVKVTLKNNEMTMTRNEHSQTITFNQLVFVNKEYTVTTRAIVIPEQFEVSWEGNIQKFDINSIFVKINTKQDA